MKRAVFYARVSTESQKDEGTIESQIAALRKQVIEAGDVLVKEYADNGYSGAKIDRPALDQFRKDLKTDLFDVVYFHNTDRIARDVVYQHLIITEILKHKKQIVINGKDYVHNPENKFELTVLGAVAELERAKIIERSQRGKLHRLKQGLLLNNGCNTYGHTYIPRDGDVSASYVINDKEAEIVRYIFESYAENGASWSKIIRHLEDIEAPTKMGKKLWRIETLKSMLQNHTYKGTKYFNTRTNVKETDTALRGIKYGKKVYKDRSQWIGIKVPAIVSQELFDKAQRRLEESKKLYRNPRETQLLSNLIKCGVCGRFFVAYQRYYRRYYNGRTNNVFHKVAYRCSRRTQQRMHSEKSDIARCRNPEIASHLLESCVFSIIQNMMVDPIKLSAQLVYTRHAPADQERFEKKLRDLDGHMQELTKQKKHTLSLYAVGKIDRDVYVQKNLWCDNEVNKAKALRLEIVKNIPNLHKREVVDVSVRQYCESVKAGLEKCADFETKRRFLLDFVDKITYIDGRVTLHGAVPVRPQTHNDPDQPSEADKIIFCIATEVVRRKN